MKLLDKDDLAMTILPSLDDAASYATPLAVKSLAKATRRVLVRMSTLIFADMQPRIWVTLGVRRWFQV